jgi:hypothetical protein
MTSTARRIAVGGSALALSLGAGAALATTPASAAVRHTPCAAKCFTPTVNPFTFYHAGKRITVMVVADTFYHA